jgi:tripartite-type tricarboxylate transporter receptor subunit TctC
VVVINKVGGGGSIGWNEVANSPPDGYIIGQLTQSINILKYTVKANIDYRKYEPIMIGGYTSAIVFGRKDLPWNTTKELIDYARANPGKVRFANSGYGSLYHLATIAVEKAAGVKFTHVPYKGLGPAVHPLLGGHVDVMLTGITDGLYLIQGGKFKVLGSASLERSKFFPDAKTFKEIGVDMNIEFGAIFSWGGPKGIPRERVNILYGLIKKCIESKEFGDFADKTGITISIKGPEEFAKYFEEGDAKWRELITVAGIKPE